MSDASDRTAAGTGVEAGDATAMRAANDTSTGGAQQTEPAEHMLEPGLRREWITLGMLATSPLVLVLLGAGAAGGGIAIVVAAWCGAALLAAAWLGARAVWRRWRYVLWDDAIEVRHGVVRHVATFVPFHRIQQVDVERGPLDRAFGIATLVLRTAAATTDAKVPGLDPRLVDDLRQKLLARAGLDDAV